MMKLLVSKIGGVSVIQVGDSKESFTHKSEDAGKVGGFLGNGSNEDIDLGFGKRTHNLKVAAFNSRDYDAIYNILYYQRYTVITDKYKGRLNVYVASADITHSETHVNKAVFEITCHVQDAGFGLSLNFGVMLSNIVRSLSGGLSGLVYQLSGIIGQVESTIDQVTGEIRFIEGSLNTLFDGASGIMAGVKSPSGAMSATRKRVNSQKRLKYAISKMSDAPDDLVEELLALTVVDDGIATDKSFNSVTKRVAETQRVERSEILPVLLPSVRGGSVFDLGSGDALVSGERVGGEWRFEIADVADISEVRVSSLEREEFEKNVIAAKIVNRVKAIRDVKSILAGGFSNREDFEKTVDATIERLNYTGISQDEVSEIVHTVKEFANEQVYREIIEIHIEDPAPLVSIVYARYGNLDEYDSIEALNGFKDNDWVSGVVKVYE